MKVPIALRIFLIGTVVLLLTAVPIFFNKAYASNIIFQDDFESGNANNWTPLMRSDLWKVASISGSMMYGARIDGPSTIIDTVGPSLGTSNYQLDFDYLPVINANTTTVDRNLDFRWVPDPSLGGYKIYEVHFWGENSVWTNFGYPSFTSPVPLLDNQINHITVIFKDQNIQFILNGIKIIDYLDTSYNFTGNDKIGLRISTGAAYPTEAWFDNIVVTSIDEPTPTPTPIPTPTPTPIPTPTPTPTPTPPSLLNLTVPALRQTDKSWSTQVYDGANFWSPMAQTIKSWGCALTSYAMVLKYFGINKLPNGTNLDPGTLNTWLKNNHGYIDGKNSGYLNPLAISSLSHQAIKINKITSFDGLEYSKITPANNLPLIDELNNNRPVVLEEPGHFIVAYGMTTSSFSIIDPYFDNRVDLTSYNNTFLSLNELNPTSTDLSYILITADQNSQIQVKNSSGNVVGTEFLQQPLVNDNTGKSAGEPLKMVYLQKPQSGDYQLSLTSSSNKLVDVNLYFYDKDGNVNAKDIPLVLSPGKPNIISFSFNKQNANNSKLWATVSFDSLILNIKNLKALHLLNSRVADELIKSIEKMQKNYNQKFKLFTQFQLSFLNESLKFYDKKLTSQDAYQIISEDIKDLINSL